MKNKKVGKKRSSKRDPKRIVGVFKWHPKGYGYLEPDDSGSTFGPLRVSRRQTGGAMAGDKVVGVLKKRGKRRGQMVFACEVVEILERASNVLVGVLQKSEQGWVMKPDGKKQQSPLLIRLESDTKAKDGDKVVAEIVQYPVADFPAVAKVREVLGKSGIPKTEILAVIRLRNLSSEFSERALLEASNAANRFENSAQTMDSFPFHRRIQNETIVTIDPVDARDFDDAVSVRPGPDGTQILGVHIADVAHFVSENTALDTEARNRSTSVYFPGLVVPMLPDVLSGGVCSLQEGRPRLAKSVYITYDSKGRVIESQFSESIIVSTKRLTYEQAETIRKGEDAGMPEKVTQTILEMERLAKRIEKRRIDRGMLHLDLKEVRLVLGADGHVEDAAAKEALYSHKMIEMFMVEANDAVAELLDEKDDPFLSRVHPTPDPEKQKFLADMLQVFGHKLSKEPSREELQELIDAVRGRPEEYAVNMALLRSLTQAEYAAEPDEHYALASRRYCHFTSPIRRYPDLVVHRLFEKHCRKKRKSNLHGDLKEMSELATHCSERERNAKDAENELRQILVLLFLATHVGEEFDGVITGVAQHGLFVQLTRFLSEGMVRFSELGDEWFELDKTAQSVRGQHSGKTYRLGQACRIRIKSVEVARRHLNLVPVIIPAI